MPPGHLGPREEVRTDGGNRIRGRKRHLLTDINGLPIAISVTSAQPHDSRGGWSLLETATPQLTRLPKVFTDAAYAGLAARAGTELGVTVDIRRRPEGTHWFVPRSSRCGASSGPSPGFAATAGSATTTRRP